MKDPEPEKAKATGEVEQPPPGITDEQSAAWIILRTRRDEILAQRNSKDKGKGSGGRKKQHILDAEVIVVEAGIPLPKNYPIAPALKKLMKTVGAGGGTQPANGPGAESTQTANVPDSAAAATAEKPVRRKRSAETPATQSQSISVTGEKKGRATRNTTTEASSSRGNTAFN